MSQLIYFFLNYGILYQQLSWQSVFAMPLLDGRGDAVNIASTALKNLCSINSFYDNYHATHRL